MKFLSSIFLLLFFASSCNSNKNEEVACTMEFRIISVEVVGAELTDYFTIRESSQDTLYLQEFNYEFFNSYPVLTDAQFSLLATNVVEDFRFVGFVDEELRVNELYRIGADRCHIFLEDGNTQINLAE